jgi:CheY-like chemotaxis protein
MNDQKIKEQEEAQALKLKVLNLCIELMKKDELADSWLNEVCHVIPNAFPENSPTNVRILFNGKLYTNANFHETTINERFNFELPNNNSGYVELFFAKTERDSIIRMSNSLFLNNIGLAINSSISNILFKKLLHDNNERMKELNSINATTEAFKTNATLDDIFHDICTFLPHAMQYPEDATARICFEKKTFTSTVFNETQWVLLQNFETPDNKKGTIEIFYLKKFPQADEGPFLKEERQLLFNIAKLVAGRVSKSALSELLAKNTERLKELHGINQTTSIINKNLPVNETLKRICTILPKSWQYPDYTAVRIKYEGNSYSSRKFKETLWVQKENFVTIDNKKGIIEVYYLKEFPTLYEGPFLKEERQLIINIAKLITGYLNNEKGRNIVNTSLIRNTEIRKSEEYRNSLQNTKKPLQQFFNKQILDKYIYLEMMRYKVKEILFVATLYDAFILENEDSFFEQFMGEIYQYSLFSLPRITGISSASEALDMVTSTHFDLVILMVGMDNKAPIELSEKIKEKQPDLPIYLLLSQKSNVKHFEELVPTIKTIDKLFVWNSDSQIIFAIVKSTEDSVNVENDTRIGLVRVILLIEDSALYYSKYLQMLYTIVFGQIQQLLPEVEKNELDKISKMRSRPKILLAKNYEEATYIFNKYKDFLLCVISDMEFDHNGKPDKTAGVKFIKYAKSHMSRLPIVLQSSDPDNKHIADQLGVRFINKNSERLLSDLKKFLIFHLGFGNFVFRDKDGNSIAVAKTLKEFEKYLQTVSAESLYLHGIDNQFSLWLMSRGEIQLAKKLNPVKVTDFSSMEEFRNQFISAIKEYRDEKKRGKILSFDETLTFDEKNIVSFASGSLGGKGRGLAFINTLIYNIDFPELKHRINIRTPITVIIGTDEFKLFMEKNHLLEKVFKPGISYDEIKQHFLNADLSSSLVKRLWVFVSQIDKPIAVRSSSIFEDSINQPFAGVFDTFIVPNNSSNKKETLKSIEKAIKMVYVSVYSEDAKAYFNAIHHKVEEEQMAIVIQELVGTQHDNYYYPDISGTAQSYNYYPVARMKPEEGYAVAAVGLGCYVVGGNKSYRFSPKYPNIDIYSTKDLLNSTQTNFYAVDLSRKNIDFNKDGELASLELLDISVAEKHGVLKHSASVYDIGNDRIETGLSTGGPRIINFADILKFDYIPLAQTIHTMLNTIKEAMGLPVEIEYAVDLSRTHNDLPSFYLLQVKPLVTSYVFTEINIDNADKAKTILYSESSLGNGEIDNICDVIFVDNDKFSKLKTLEMAKELEHLNMLMTKQNRKYVLIGPGRWGTRDYSLGIPVTWSQISNAQIIVEISLANYPLDASLGSHFFHNVTSMNIGYLSVLDTSLTDFIRWDVLNKQTIINKTNYFKHIRFKRPLKILMNGKLKKSAILYNH